MRIYQVFTGRMKEANLLDHEDNVFYKMGELSWSRLLDIGVTHIYLLGVFDYRGPIIVTDEEGVNLREQKDRIPSCFAIRDHKNVHPSLGSLDEFKKLVEVVHKQGLRVMIDFVPNQTGMDHEWMQSKPGYYQNFESGVMTGFSGDVAMLDYNNPNLRQELVEVVLNLLTWGVDGVRCDMAHLAPISFWEQTILRVKEKMPKFQFWAEAYSESVFDWKPIISLLDAGFDSIYHEFLYRNVKDNLRLGQLTSLVEHLNYFVDLKESGRFINYLSNHDDGLPFNYDLMSGWWFVISTLPGSTFLFNGVLNGKGSRLAHHYVDLLSESENELNVIPEWALNQYEILQKLKPKFVRAYLENETLKIDYETDDGEMTFIMNLFKKEASDTENHIFDEVVYKHGSNNSVFKTGDWGLYK